MQNGIWAAHAITKIFAYTLELKLCIILLEFFHMFVLGSHTFTAYTHALHKWAWPCKCVYCITFNGHQKIWPMSTIIRTHENC